MAPFSLLGYKGVFCMSNSYSPDSYLNTVNIGIYEICKVLDSTYRLKS